jgi:hypothetical protein
MVDELLIKGYECGDWINDYDPAVSDPSNLRKRLKFQQGDWVVPIDFANNKFQGSRHPSWVWKAYGQVGEVIGTYSGSAGAHYAVRFPVLKKVFPIHLFFLQRATTEEIETAKKDVQFNDLKKKLPELEGIF